MTKYFFFLLCLYSTFSFGETLSFQKEYEKLLKNDLVSYQENEIELDKLKSLVSTQNQQEDYKKMYCWNHDFSGDYTEGIKYAEESILKSKNKENVEDFKLCKAMYVYTLANKKEALNIIDNVGKNIEKIKNLNIKNDYYLLKAQINSDDGDLYEGLQNYLKAKEIFEKQGYTSRENNVLLSIGDLYRRFGDLDKAKSFYEEILNGENDLNIRRSVFSGMGFLGLESKNYTSALHYFQEAKQIDDQENKNNKLVEAINNLEIAVSYIYLGNIEIGKNLLKNSELYITEKNDPVDFGFLHLYKAVLLTKENKTKEALENFKITEKIFNKLDNNRYKIMLYKNLIPIYEKLGDTENALKYLKLKDSLEEFFQKNLKISETIYLQEKFEVQKKQLENQKLKIERNFKEKQVENLKKIKQLQIVALFLSIVMVVLLILWTWKLNTKNKELKSLAMTDELTKIANRRFVINLLEKKLQQKTEDLSVIILDIDFFKDINDKYGHDIGDKVLIEVSDNIKKCLRKTDVLGRIGGEEFLIVLENTNLQEAEIVAEKIKNSIGNLSIKTEKNIIKITISLGVSQHIKEDMKELIANADKSLYVSKNTGKNKVTLFKDNLVTNF